MTFTSNRIALAGAATALLFLSTPVSGQANCIDNISDLVNAEYDVTDINTLRTYVLCPDTTFKIATYDEASDSYTGGQSALELFQPNLHVLCGDDGSVENNCVFTGGTFHVASFLFEDTDPALQNVLVSGITFSGSDYNVEVTSKGEMVFKDCKWAGNDNLALVFMMGAGTLDNKVTLDGCTFESNTVRFTEGDLVTGLIWNDGQELVIKNCLFNDNTVVSPNGLAVPDEWTTFVVGAFSDSETELYGSCFIDNKNIFAPMYGENSIYRVDPGGELTFASGDYGCNGLAEFIAEEPFQYECFKFTGETCPLLPAPAPIDPTIAPTFVPTETPTLKPTSKPTVSPMPTVSPTFQPTDKPTLSPMPTGTPTLQPTEAPTEFLSPSCSSRSVHGRWLVFMAACITFCGMF